MNEQLLRSYLLLQTSFKASRYVTYMNYNEAVVCNFLIISEMQFSELVENTNMLKSQVHRVVSSLEKKGYVKKYKKEDNKKSVYIALTDTGIKIYSKMHSKIIEYANHISSKLGEEDTKEFIKLIEKSIEIIKEVDNNDKNNN